MQFLLNVLTQYATHHEHHIIDEVSMSNVIFITFLFLNWISFLTDDYILREGAMWQNKKSSINQNICQLLTPGCCSNQSAVTECSQGSPKKYLRTSDLILYNRWQTKIIFYFPNSDTSWFILFAILFLIRQENIILSNPSKSVFLDAWHNKSVNFQTSKVLVIEFLFPI